MFGRNASAGLISVITAKPRFQTAVNGQIDIGNYDMRRIELGVTGPLSARPSRRASTASIMKRDGFIEGRRSPAADVNNRDRWLLRGQLLFQPNDDLSVRLIGDYAKRDEECCAAPYLPAERLHRRRRPQAVDDQAADGIARRRSSTTIPIERKCDLRPGAWLSLATSRTAACRPRSIYDFGGAELTSITAYRDNK